MGLLSAQNNRHRGRFIDHYRTIGGGAECIGIVAAFSMTLLLAGHSSKTSPYRIAEIIYYGPQNVPGLLPEKQRDPSDRGFANLQYKPGKAFRPIDAISNVALPPLVAYGVVVPLVALRRSRQRSA